MRWVQEYGWIRCLSPVVENHDDGRHKAEHDHDDDVQVTDQTVPVEEKDHSVQQNVQLEVGTDEPTDDVALEHRTDQLKHAQSNGPTYHFERVNVVRDHGKVGPPIVVACLRHLARVMLVEQRARTEHFGP